MSAPSANATAFLRALAEKHGGRLFPEVVVEAARPANSVIHDAFTWDNTAAAHKWRLHQARNLIRVSVEYTAEDKEKTRPHQVFVALRSEAEDGGGYRRTVDVLSDDDMRASLLEQAHDDMLTFSRKYRHLTQLAKVIEAMDGLVAVEA